MVLLCWVLWLYWLKGAPDRSHNLRKDEQGHMGSKVGLDLYMLLGPGSSLSSVLFS